MRPDAIVSLSVCSAVAALQVALALGSLLIGQPQLAGAFAIFAVIQAGTLLVEGCGLGAACRARLEREDAPWGERG